MNSDSSFLEFLSFTPAEQLKQVEELNATSQLVRTGDLTTQTFL